ncbi:hypothetical protein EVAR_80796_1 [Eumeta japonica]|uniref:Uncharacterized protein n=1 Tax=Eumeta variegata TaxID=151549 RepID=A0A4C1WCL3_EUMVA|nr:hypothetical protein EVAR_80796_1 [Eumeta japonica]
MKSGRGRRATSSPTDGATCAEASEAIETFKEAKDLSSLRRINRQLQNTVEYLLLNFNMVASHPHTMDKMRQQWRRIKQKAKRSTFAHQGTASQTVEGANKRKIKRSHLT